MTATEIRYAFLDSLPVRLFRPTVTNRHGSVMVRGAAILKLRESLLAGRLPGQESIGWPEDPTVRGSLLEALRDADLPEYCTTDPEQTDEVLLFVLRLVDEAHDFHDRALVNLRALTAKAEREDLRPRRSDGA